MRKVSCKAKPHDRGKLPLVILEKKVGPFIYSSGVFKFSSSQNSTDEIFICEVTKRT